MPGEQAYTILMADDDEDDCFLVKDAFAESGLNVQMRFVEDGELLMDLLNRRGKYLDSTEWPKPDLILLDLNMPRKDGRSALKEIKSDQQFEGIPVVIFTTSTQDRDMKFCEQAGASRFIIKPDNFDDLIEELKSLIRLLSKT